MAKCRLCGSEFEPVAGDQMSMLGICASEKCKEEFYDCRYYLACSCCGKGITNTPEQNTDYVDGVTCHPHDVGYGMCKECGGDPQAKGDDEVAVKERLGWALTAFIDARIPLVRRALTDPVKLAKFDGFSYLKKVQFIQKCIEKGLMI